MASRVAHRRHRAHKHARRSGHYMLLARSGGKWILYHVGSSKLSPVASYPSLSTALQAAREYARAHHIPVVVYTGRVTKHQIGEPRSYERDRARKALPPGLRISRTGHLYYEYRANRTDMPGRLI